MCNVKLTPGQARLIMFEGKITAFIRFRVPGDARGPYCGEGESGVETGNGLEALDRLGGRRRGGDALYDADPWGLGSARRVQVVMEAKETDRGARARGEVIERAQAVVERRINALGVAEPVIQRQGDRRIIVELPGVHDQAAGHRDHRTNGAAGVSRPRQATPSLPAPNLRSATLSNDEFGRPAVEHRPSTGKATAQFAQLTARYAEHQSSSHRPRRRDLGRTRCPRGRSTTARPSSPGNFTLEEARNLAILLQSGSLPVPLEVMEVRNVGPVLGQESVQRA